MRYSASASAIGPAGRKVRCASCGHNWLVDSEGEEQGTSVAAEKDTAEPTQEPVETKAAPEPEIEPEKPRDPQVAQAIRARREAERQKQKRLRAAGVWGGVMASFLLVLAAAWVFQVDVVRIWPKTASAYALLGHPGNLFGLEVHDITAVRKTRDGASVLQLSANIVNTSNREQTIPLLQAELHDDKGKIVLSWRIELEQAQLQPEQTFAFVTEIRDAPPDALDVKIGFTDEQVQPRVENPGSHEPEETHEPTKTAHDEPKPPAH